MSIRIKYIFALVLLAALLGLAAATPSCVTSDDCPAYQQCHMEGTNEVCNYTNPCMCNIGLLYNIVDSTLCTVLAIPGLTCSSLPCGIGGGHCQYDGNM